MQSSEQQKKDILKVGPNFNVALQVDAAAPAQVLGRNKRDRRGINESGSHRIPPSRGPQCYTCAVPRYQTDPSWLDLALKLGLRTRMPVCRHALSVFSKSRVAFRRGERRDDGQVRLQLFHNALFVDCRRLAGRCGRSRR